MAELNHWIEELPEFGVTSSIISLLEEQRKARSKIEYYLNRIEEIDAEMLFKVEQHWKTEDISEAKKRFEFNRR